MVQPQDTAVSLQYMLNGSRAVLTRPNASTFEEYERNNLSWALIYISIAAVVTAVLGAIGFLVRQPFATTPAGVPPELAAAQPTLVGAIFGNLFGTLIGFLIYMGIVFLLGRAFGGTGQFGELAFDFSLFVAPLAVVNALVGIVAIGPLAIVTGLVGLALAIYNFYLSYISVQSGMNLPPNKALWVVLIPAIVGLLLVCGIVVLVGGLLAATLQGQ
jgi:hypothetical protein